MEKFILISVGAVLGANTRYWISDWAAQKFGSDFPYGTLLINLTGSFLLGLFVSLAAERLTIDPKWRYLVAVGFLGAYTTFSTFTFESYSLLWKGQWLSSLFNQLGSTVLGVIAAGLGVYLGKLV